MHCLFQYPYRQAKPTVSAGCLWRILCDKPRSFGDLVCREWFATVSDLKNSYEKYPYPYTQIHPFGIHSD